MLRKSYYIITLCLLILSGFSSESKGQDLVFSQFYMAPMQLNPSFAGNTYAPLIHLNSRIQWPAIDLAYRSISASYDQFFKKYRSGVGISLMNDSAGNGILNTFRLDLNYAYVLRVKKQHFIKMGIGLGLVQKRLNWEKLIFPDQLDPEFGYTDSNGNTIVGNEIQPDRLGILYPDLSTGLLYYNSYFYLGLAVAHVNNPHGNYFEFGSEENSGVSNRYSLQVGGQIPLSSNTMKKEYFLSPGILYASQAGIKQLNISMILNMGTIYAGIGYREAFDNPDAVISMFGFQNGLYKMGYSYDLTVSKLSVGSGGSHELGLIINFDYSDWFEKPFRYSDCFEIFR